MASVGVAVGYFLTSGSEHFQLNNYAATVAFFVCGFGNILNDIVDIESDCVNHPHRPLPKGLISKPAAIYTLFLFLIISLALLLFLENAERVLVLLAVVMLTIYNFKLKYTPYWGNIAVSILAAMTFILGGVTVSMEGTFEIPGPLIPAAFAFLMHFGREIIKDIADRGGDIMIGSKTAPARGRLVIPLILVLLVFTILILLSLAVYQQGWFNNIYLLTVSIGVNLPLAIVCIWILFKRKQVRYDVIAGMIKLMMVPGIVSLIIGKAF
jgi:geranylgeranylglycerol-phosphate geranylgeranyltransferase